MTGAAASEPVLVNVAGAKVLALVVTDAGDGPAFDHADWADAQLHCGTTSVPQALLPSTWRSPESRFLLPDSVGVQRQYPR